MAVPEESRFLGELIRGVDDAVQPYGREVFGAAGIQDRPRELIDLTADGLGRFRAGQQLLDHRRRRLGRGGFDVGMGRSEARSPIKVCGRLPIPWCLAAWFKRGPGPIRINLIGEIRHHDSLSSRSSANASVPVGPARFRKFVGLLLR